MHSGLTKHDVEANMRIYDIIEKKRLGLNLTGEEIRFFVDGYTRGSVPDYQASALLMAICINGMNEEETALLTDAMMRSGDTVDLSCFGDLSVDKHSTGGVGDKTTLVVAPVVASLGGKVAKMSGRGLGHTGGTVDKLESIPGYRTTLSAEELVSQVDNVGVAVIGQSGNLAPADKKLYALRDVTATVESLPLIASSIMSKKLAAGSKSIVLDVKVGSGAFMHTPEDAEHLAREMVAIGKRCGRNMTAVLTDMNFPLGYAVGNALEVCESIDVLRGRERGELREVCVVLSSEMAALAMGISPDRARVLVEDAIESGRAYDKFLEWIECQGGDVEYVRKNELFPKALSNALAVSPRDGFVCSIDARAIGNISAKLGAGRAAKDDKIDYSAGIVIKKKVGDRVRIGEPLAVIYSSSEDKARDGAWEYLSAISIGDESPAARPVVYKIIR